jgi:hypothetical protein
MEACVELKISYLEFVISFSSLCPSDRRSQADGKGGGDGAKLGYSNKALASSNLYLLQVNSSHPFLPLQNFNITTLPPPATPHFLASPTL